MIKSPQHFAFSAGMLLLGFVLGAFTAHRLDALPKLVNVRPSSMTQIGPPITVTKILPPCPIGCERSYPGTGDPECVHWTAEGPVVCREGTIYGITPTRVIPRLACWGNMLGADAKQWVEAVRPCTDDELREVFQITEGVKR